MKKSILNAFRKLGYDIRKYHPAPYGTVVSLQPENGFQGNVLLSLWIEPFLMEKGAPVPNTHTHHWGSLQIAKTFLDFGYAVDVIDYRNKDFIPKKEYAFFLAFRTNFERIAQYLNPDCLKIAHLDTAHWAFNNYSTYRRTIDLQRRRGYTLKSGQRIIEHNLAIEYADCATVEGDRFSIDTYRYAQKPIYRIPHSTCATYPWPEGKDFDASRKSFLWMGSDGFVHKGLDLVLDAFAEMPDFNLYVCGPIGRSEEQFEEVYRKELYHTQNIHTVGWVDVESSEFMNILNKCIGIVYPSCSESAAGTVLVCMHAGLVPVISYETGIDIDKEVGVTLMDSTVDEIKGAVLNLAEKPPQELKAMARRTWELARSNYTRERFSEVFREIIRNFISGKTSGAMNNGAV